MLFICFYFGVSAYLLYGKFVILTSPWPKTNYLHEAGNVLASVCLSAGWQSLQILFTFLKKKQ